MALRAPCRQLAKVFRSSAASAARRWQPAGPIPAAIVPVSSPSSSPYYETSPMMAAGQRRLKHGSKKETSTTSPPHHRASTARGTTIGGQEAEARQSGQLARDGGDISVVQDATGSFLVAKRKLVAGDVLFGGTPGTTSAVRSRHSIQVAEDLHLTASDDLQLISHGCTPNCQLELVEGSSTAAGEGPCVRAVVIAPEILEGGKLSVDYNAFEVEMTSSFDCTCGAVNCRGRISGFSRLPPSVQEEYVQGRWSTSVVGEGGSGAPPLLTKVVKAWVESNSVRRG